LSLPAIPTALDRFSTRAADFALPEAIGIGCLHSNIGDLTRYDIRHLLLIEGKANIGAAKFDAPRAKPSSNA
jgi:hypothetical protein